MKLNMDEKFKAYFQDNLKQVFLYLVDDCNLRCKQCLYKLDIAFHVDKREIEYEDAVSLIETFRSLGAVKLTLMGGEPTLYGIKEKRKPLLNLIKKAKELGYQYVRIDTNGQFESELLEEPEFKMLDEITFSVDGPNAEINDKIRGQGSFNKCVKNIKRAKELGYNVDITSCISKYMIERNSKGELYLDEMIKFSQKIGIEKINFHNLFKVGVPRDHYTGSLNLSIKEWFETWKEIQDKIDNDEYEIPVRMPQSFVTKKAFNKNPEYYGYCSCKNKSRVLAHPNGMIRVCSLLIGTPYGIAKFYDNKIVWDDSPTNELRCHEMNKNTPCTNQFKNNKFGEYLPVCVSFKPNQDEIIWNELEWEKRKKGRKIRTLVAHDNKKIRDEIIKIIQKINYAQIVGVAKDGEETYEKIVDLKPEMVFAQYDLEKMDSLEIIKKSKEKLDDELPIFNIISDKAIPNDLRKMTIEAGDNLNAVIQEEERLDDRVKGIFKDYRTVS